MHVTTDRITVFMAKESMTSWHLDNISGEKHCYVFSRLGNSHVIHMTYTQAECLTCRKSRDPTLNAVYWEDAGSKIQFSLISVYKKMGLMTSKSWFR